LAEIIFDDLLINGMIYFFGIFIYQLSEILFLENLYIN